MHYSVQHGNRFLIFLNILFPSIDDCDLLFIDFMSDRMISKLIKLFRL